MSDHSSMSSAVADLNVVEDKIEEVIEDPVAVKLCSTQAWNDDVTCLNLAQYVALDKSQCSRFTDVLLQGRFPPTKPLLAVVSPRDYQTFPVLNLAAVRANLKPATVTQLSLIGHSLSGSELAQLLTEIGPNLTHLTVRPFKWTAALRNVALTKLTKLTHLSVGFERDCQQVPPMLSGGLTHLSTFPFGYAAAGSQEPLVRFPVYFAELQSLGLDVSPNTPDEAWHAIKTTDGASSLTHITSLTIATPVTERMLGKIIETFEHVESFDVTIVPEMHLPECFQCLSKMRKLKHLMIRSTSEAMGTGKDVCLWGFAKLVNKLSKSVTKVGLKMLVEPQRFEEFLDAVPGIKTVFVDQCRYRCRCQLPWRLLPIAPRVDEITELNKCEHCFGYVKTAISDVCQQS